MSTILINTERSKTETEINVFTPGKDTKSTITLPNEDVKPVLASNGIIDVVNSFSWYAGPPLSHAALNKIPCAFLIEREQKLSSLISGALYYLNASAKGIDAAIKTAQQAPMLKSLLSKLNVGDSLAKKMKALAGSVAGNLTVDTQLLTSHNLKSLQGIYLTKETGFQYRLPFYNSSHSFQQGWGDRQKDNLLTGIVDAGTEIVENVSGYVNIAQPGVYIEKPKYFNTAESGESREITFPLINTINRHGRSAVQANYELLWLLTFQNRPYKTSFSRTPPPKLYTISVPGQFSFPYAYISNMQVEFLGTTRRTNVTIPTLGAGDKISPKSINVPVPEAYNVSITFTSLIGEYGNTMMSDAVNPSISKNGGVTFGSI